MKKILAFLSAISLISAVSCSEKAPVSSSETETVSRKEIIAEDISLKNANINMAEDFSEIIRTDSKVASILIFGKLKNGGFSGYITDKQFAEKKTFSFTPEEGENVIDAALMRFGKIAVLTEKGGEAQIHCFDQNGELEKIVNLGNILPDSNTYAHIIGGEDECYLSIGNDRLVHINKDGNTADIDIADRIIYGLTNNSEGKPCALLMGDDMLYLDKLENGEISEELPCDMVGDTIHSLGSGFGDSLITAIFADGLYKFDGSDWTRVSDFSDNPIDTLTIRDIVMTDENEFAVMMRKNDQSSGMALLSERDISELKQKKIIRMTNFTQANFSLYDDAMKQFNAENEDYKIELVDYFGEEGYEQLKLDMLSGNAPDIVNSAFIDSLGSKDNIFVDLYTLMDNDPDINRDKFLDGFLEGMEYKGKLLQISSEFTVHTVAIKDKFAGGLTGWDIHQFEGAYLNMPENMIFSQFTEEAPRTDVFMDFINCNAFFDCDSASCSFDSPEFIDAMKIIGENKIGLSRDEAERLDGISMFTDDIVAAYRNDKALVFPWAVGNFNDIQNIEQGYMGDPVTFIGYPTESGCGSYRMIYDGYGIMANSENIDGAWEFLKCWLFGDNETLVNGFSGIEEKYLQQLEDAKHPIKEINPETGAEEEFKRIFVLESNADPEKTQKIEIEPFSDEQAEKYDKFIRTAVKNPVKSDSVIEKILQEELEYYFEGERSAEETADIIQNRATIYLSENYS